MSIETAGYLATAELKPFRSRGLVRRVTPFIGTGVIALAVLVDPSLVRQWTDVLAIVIAGATIAAALGPFDWDRLPGLAIALPLVAALMLVLSGKFSGGPGPVVTAVMCGVLVAAIYGLPWDRLPRWAHDLPPLGGIAAVFAIQLTTGGLTLLIFPLLLVVVLFVALHYSRRELLAAAALAAAVIIIPAAGVGGHPGQLAATVVTVVTLAVMVTTVPEIVRKSRIAGTEADRMTVQIRTLVDRLESANERLQEADKAKSVFLANMSHELRTPLNAILGFSELLMDDGAGRFTEASRKRFLEQIHSSGKHLLGLINDILDLSKVEAGQMDLRLEPVTIDDAVEEVLRTIEPLAAARGIKLASDAAAGGEVIADAGKLKQMLLNLVSNAIKFTPQGGQVTVSASRSLNVVEIAVADTGIGIARGDQERIFHEFQQLDSGIGRKVDGTGLGLALTRRLAALHGGAVRVSSVPGRGSVFTLSLPVHAATRERSAAASKHPSKGDADDSARPLVLIAEDNPQAAELVRRNLEHGGFRTEIAVSGPEVLAKARELQPMAITLDILLPELDGWEVLTRLKKDETTSEIPVVIVSIVDSPELGIALGALDYFVKPVPAKELLKRLSRFNFKLPDGREDVRILVVDDEEPNVTWLAQVLEPAGFTVITAAGGQEAIRVARSKSPDLILLDLMMPGISGFDVVEALRADKATRSIPIMVITAKDLTDEDKRQLNGHVSTILSRGSTDATDLLGHMQEVVAHRAGAS